MNWRGYPPTRPSFPFCSCTSSLFCCESLRNGRIEVQKSDPERTKDIKKHRQKTKNKDTQSPTSSRAQQQQHTRALPLRISLVIWNACKNTEQSIAQSQEPRGRELQLVWASSSVSIVESRRELSSSQRDDHFGGHLLELPKESETHRARESVSTFTTKLNFSRSTTIANNKLHHQWTVCWNPNKSSSLCGKEDTEKYTVRVSDDIIEKEHHL